MVRLPAERLRRPIPQCLHCCIYLTLDTTPRRWRVRTRLRSQLPLRHSHCRLPVCATYHLNVLRPAYRRDGLFIGSRSPTTHLGVDCFVTTCYYVGNRRCAGQRLTCYHGRFAFQCRQCLPATFLDQRLRFPSMVPATAVADPAAVISLPTTTLVVTVIIQCRSFHC